MRDKTRRERYYEKLAISETFPISVATVNFKHEVNLAYTVRAAVCFGIEEVCVIGSHPRRKIINELSGSLFDYIKIKYFSSPNEFIRYSKEKDTKLISIELPSDTMDACSITDYNFEFSKPICLVIGNETTGVPSDILFNSDIVFIEMYGAGFCLNASQACNIALYETTKQFKKATLNNG